MPADVTQSPTMPQYKDGYDLGNRSAFSSRGTTPSLPLNRISRFAGERPLRAPVHSQSQQASPLRASFDPYSAVKPPSLRQTQT